MPKPVPPAHRTGTDGLMLMMLPSLMMLPPSVKPMAPKNAKSESLA